MSVFVSDELFPVVVKYVEIKQKNGGMGLKVIKTPEQEKLYGDRVKEIQTQWITPSWKVRNEALRRSSRWSPEAGDTILDWILYRATVMDAFMKSWDLTDDDGVLVPLTVENIAKLDPNIAGELADSFLRKITVTEEELGE